MTSIGSTDILVAKPRHAASNALLQRVRGVSPSLVLASLIIALVVLFALAPSLFTSFNPVQGVPAENSKPRASSISSAPTRWVATSMPASFMARCTR